jgi:hypothetical protein
VTPEGRVKAKIDAVLRNTMDIWWFKPVQNGMGRRALDYVGCSRGDFFTIEAKREGESPTAFQNLTSLGIHTAGGKVFHISCDEGVLSLQRWLHRP